MFFKAKMYRQYPMYISRLFLNLLYYQLIKTLELVQSVQQFFLLFQGLPI